MGSEVMKVLNMVQENKITAEEGAKLIEAIKQGEVSKEVVREEAKTNLIQSFDCHEDVQKIPGERMLRIKVHSSDGEKVKITLPLKFIVGMIKATGKMPTINSNIKGVNSEELMNSILTAADSGMKGKILEVETDSGEHIKIVID
ncbi:SHOCT-like domain-containing protein [Oceanirhabdus sp. W0125-5]|uniref:SHOCT-like domain-containing protein n=1 Tax=Oceanirhabdus sp. W0125-5 TaxID=2999116 RepID=UPI0022F2AC4B|nr:hypothetical protein [Oceanirhabdus sp. W0125-5]WBW95160.1 hypothetical protein OW730_15865 [Oceanirhabdus sp. W0125-5]